MVLVVAVLLVVEVKEVPVATACKRVQRSVHIGTAKHLMEPQLDCLQRNTKWIYLAESESQTSW